jgi:hypothetical protein
MESSFSLALIGVKSVLSVLSDEARVVTFGLRRISVYRYLLAGVIQMCSGKETRLKEGARMAGTPLLYAIIDIQ